LRLRAFEKAIERYGVGSGASRLVTGNLDLGGTTRTFTVGDGATTLDLHIFAVINNGGLTKMGPGTLRLAGPASNAYTGATTVAAGTLELNKGVGSLAVVGDLVINGGTARELAGNQIGDSSNVSVSSGGTFDLNGQTDAIGTVTVTGGTLSFSGTTAGRLTAGNTSLNATSTLVMKLVDTGNSDHISVNGTVVVGGNLQLSVPSAISVGTAIRLIDNNSGSATTGTFAGLPQGAAFFVGGQLFGIGYTGDTGNDVVVTRISGPAVIGTQVNDGAAQRSRVTSLSVSFSAQVTFAGTVESAFTLTHFGGGAVAFTAIAVNFNNRTTVTLNGFTGSETQFGSLADGRYTLTALASQISAGGIQLDGNGDGLAGDNYAFGGAQGLFRFFGDINGDQHVDVADFGLFSSTFNLSTGQTGFLAAFDFNADGHIDIADFGQFSLRFFTVLP
jgi:autotransporter-associated beta strand protein